MCVFYTNCFFFSSLFALFVVNPFCVFWLRSRGEERGVWAEPAPQSRRQSAQPGCQDLRGPRAWGECSPMTLSRSPWLFSLLKCPHSEWRLEESFPNFDTIEIKYLFTLMVTKVLSECNSVFQMPRTPACRVARHFLSRSTNSVPVLCDRVVSLASCCYC